MLELADIFRAYGPAYRQTYGDRMLPRHTQALWDIEHGRTPMLGGACYYCPQCRAYQYSYHSCGNRHCPTCESDRADHWRNTQLEHLLPVPYFLVTGTLPHTLNPRARAHQKLIDDLLFQTSADALQTLARNPKWLGGTIGLVGVRHTWDRSRGYHLHVHYLLPAGGIDPTTGAWTSSHPKFLVPGSALRTVFRATFRDALKTAAPELFAQVPPDTWTTTWVVHCQAVGDGRTALKYLAPYIYRVALSNRRLVSLDHGTVTFRYKPRHQPWKTMTLDALAFIQRFLQHILPKGFQKSRETFPVTDPPDPIPAGQLGPADPVSSSAADPLMRRKIQRTPAPRNSPRDAQRGHVQRWLVCVAAHNTKLYSVRAGTLRCLHD